MEIRGLRIGNKIQDEHGFIFDVVGIGKDWITVDFEGNEGDVWEFDFKHSFPQPIELTEEILLKCGFVKCGVMADLTLNISYNRVLCYNHDHETVNMAQHTGGFKNLRDVHLNKINYLHQLQNLYFYLTGEELNIEL